MDHFPSVAMIGGGNMANALVSGLLNRHCPKANLHVVEVHEPLRHQWSERGISVSAHADEKLSAHQVWIFAVKPQQMRDVMLQTRRWLKPDTLVISIAAGISIASLATWLNDDGKPWQRLVRCMPNTPALVGAGVTGMAAPAALLQQDRDTASALLSTVGEVVWVADDQAIDAVTALSGSGPAYVFLFIEALIAGATKLGLSPEQSRSLALATLAGATKLAADSTEPIAVLRERVTSKGGTTAAALDLFKDRGLTEMVEQAMQAASIRAAELSQEFGGS